jgi:hypothetical protein
MAEEQKAVPGYLMQIWKTKQPGKVGKKKCNQMVQYNKSKSGFL